MSEMLAGVDAWITGLLLAAAMVAAWRVGLWYGRTVQARTGAAPGDKFEDASMALLGLLLAFTFSLALAKHDRRREALIADSNAIGDFYTCATLLPDPVRTRLQGVIRDYAQRRLAVALKPSTGLTEETLKSFVAQQGRMTELVAEALRSGTPIAVPLTNTLNGLTSSHAARLAAVRDRLPWSVVALLVLAATVTTGLIGRQQAASPRASPLGTLSFIVLVTLVIYITLDLNQPRRGLIQVSQEPLERLFDSMAP